MQASRRPVPGRLYGLPLLEPAAHRDRVPAAANRKVTHPERGDMTFQTIVETMAGHDLNHLAQLQKMAATA